MNYVSRFCRSLGTMLQAQVSLLEALEIAKRTITISEVRNEINSLITQVRRGSAISSGIAASKFFPPMVTQMILVGEETSELDKMLLKVADYFDAELDNKVESISSIIEPVLILTLGIIVACVVVAMYLPMFDVANSIGGLG